MRKGLRLQSREQADMPALYLLTSPTTRRCAGSFLRRRRSAS
jgi:hypothetical protein